MYMEIPYFHIRTGVSGSFTCNNGKRSHIRYGVKHTKSSCLKDTKEEYKTDLTARIYKTNILVTQRPLSNNKDGTFNRKIYG